LFKMKNKFSKSWKSSKQPRKQRKYIANAPLNIKRKMLAGRLSKDLTKRYSRRSLSVRKGDTVKVLRGNFKDHSGKIEKVLTKRLRVYIEGIQNLKRDGNKMPYPIHPSNLVIIELDLGDKERQKMLERGKLGSKNEQKTPKND
jgi:large subunit ribosomal protein L24